MKNSSTESKDTEDTSALFIKHKNSVFGYLLRFLKCPEDANDILQETWFRLIRFSKSHQIKDESKSLIFSIAKNLAHDKTRSNTKYRDAINHLTTYSSQPHLSPSPEDFAQHENAKLRLLQTLDKLNPKIRDVFIMRRYMNKSSKDIAIIMNITERTVERRMEKCLTTLRIELSEYLNEDV